MGDELCRNHVWRQPSDPPLRPAVAIGNASSLFAFDQTEFLSDFNVGFDAKGFVYAPSACYGKRAESNSGCGLHVKFHGCGGAGPPSTNDLDVRVAEANGVVLLIPR